MKILDYRRPPASYWRVPHDNFHYFIIFHYFGHILTHAKVYLLFVDAARAIIDFVQSTFCYNEGSGHVLMWGMISSSKNNWVGHIAQMFLGIMTSRTARSYFKRFHWISSVVLMSYSSCTQVGFPHPSRVTVPCDTAIYVDTALKAVAERYIVLGWTSCICNSPPLPPTYVLLASICFVLLNTRLKLIPRHMA